MLKIKRCLTIYYDDIQNLILRLNDPNHEIRKKSAMELGKIRTIRAAPALIQQIYRDRYHFYITKSITYNVTEFYFKALQDIGPQITQYLINELIDSPDDVFEEFKKILKNFKLNSYQMLKSLFRSEEDPYYLNEILMAWILLKEEDAFEEVRSYLHHVSEELVKAACLYYFQLGIRGLNLIEKELFDGNIDRYDEKQIKKQVIREIYREFKIQRDLLRN